MNITLISPQTNIENYGLRIISACLKKAGHKTRLIFMPKKSGENYEKETLNELVDLSKDADLIGISLMTNFFEQSVQITKKLKKELAVPIIWGGVHPTVKPKECLRYADMVCRGEGEEAIVELAEKMEKKENYYTVKNICFKDKRGNFIFNPLRPLIQDLDSLPFQDYDSKTQHILLEEKSYRMDEFFSRKIKHYCNLLSFRGYTTFFSRGCPFSCTFCHNNHFNKLYSGQNIFRKRSADNVIEELKQARNYLSFAKLIWLNDDYFFGLPLEDIKEFSEKYKQNIKLPFGIVGAYPTAINREKLNYLVEAGLFFIKIGVQTGSEKIKKIYGRNYSNFQVEKANKIINEFKNRIPFICYELLIDNPWETEKDSIETLMFLTRFPVPCHFDFFSLTLYPGTELYHLAKKEGFIKNELKEIYRKNLYMPRKTYLYKLSLLLDKYSQAGKKISSKIIFLLTNKSFRKLKLNWLLYFLLYFFAKTYIQAENYIKERAYIVSDGFIYKKNHIRATLRVIKRGDWRRIIEYLKQIFLKS